MRFTIFTMVLMLVAASFGQEPASPRIMPKAVSNLTESVALIAAGASTPALAQFDPKSDNGR